MQEIFANVRVKLYYFHHGLHLHVGLPVDPLDVVRALRVAVAGAVRGPRAVAGVVQAAVLRSGIAHRHH